MSYEGTKCPCGGKKERETMLCKECVNAFKDMPELKEYQSKGFTLDHRQHCAMKLCSLSRRRKHAAQQTLALNVAL